MHPKLNLIKPFEEEKEAWEKRESALRKEKPLKGLKSLPKMPGVTKETARFLRLKSLTYLLKHDKNRTFLKYFFKNPIKYGLRLFRSYLKRSSYKRYGDFYLYGLTKKIFEEKVKTAPIFVLGFSYCHKPFECPSGRFTDKCIHDPKHPVCGQCFIGKCANLSKKTHLLFIPTVHYIGEKMWEIVHQNPKSEITFMITACEMSLKMFGDWGNMIGIKGIGVRLDGRICNTMRAFELSENGIKPGLTVVLDDTKQKMLDFLKLRS